MPEEITRDQGVFVFSPENKPVLTIDSGQEVVFVARDAFSGQISSEEDSPEDLDFSRVNRATGPVFVRGAVPGTSLKVEIEEILMEDTGYQCVVPGFGLLKDRFTSPITRRCEIRDGHVYVGRHRFPVRPNIGTIGVAPASGEIPTIQPGDHGGNLDAREIGEGTTLYLPVFVEGGLLAMGDVHALQGDGEVCGVAVEIGARIKVRVSVSSWNIKRPVLLDGDTILTLASAQDLDEAAHLATGDMVDILAQAGFGEEEAYTYLALVGHLGISQAVNPWRTAKVVAPRPEGFSR